MPSWRTLEHCSKRRISTSNQACSFIVDSFDHSTKLKRRDFGSAVDSGPGFHGQKQLVPGDFGTVDAGFHGGGRSKLRGRIFTSENPDFGSRLAFPQPEQRSSSGKARTLPSEQQPGQHNPTGSSAGSHRQDCSTNTQQLKPRIITLEQLRGAVEGSGHEKFSPEVYGKLLQACTRLRALAEGRTIHEHIVRNRDGEHLFLRNYLIHMYAKCGSLKEAEQVFGETRVKNVVSWTSMICGYVDHGLTEQAFRHYEQMQLEDVRPTRVTFVTILSACQEPAHLESGKQIHEQILKSGMQVDAVLETAVMTMYARCGCLDLAEGTLNRSQVKDEASWNAIISAYAAAGQYAQGLLVFHKMQLEGVVPNTITFVSVLNACRALRDGELIHKCVLDSGIQADVFLETALVNVYGRCGRLELARNMFDRMRHQNVVSWNAMMTLYVDSDQGGEAMKLFWRMHQESVSSDKITFVAALNACQGLHQGIQVHSAAAESGWGLNQALQNALVSMYSRCGDLDMARRVFDRMPCRDEVSWTSIIAAYYQQNQGEEALLLFRQMQEQKVKVDAITLTTMLHTCANLAALRQGKDIHAEVVRRGMDKDPTVNTALVNMYSKCGCFDDAAAVFSRMNRPDSVTWNALIGARAQHGDGEGALKLFRRMQQEGGAKSDDITFVIVLCACNHAGLMEEACTILASMISEFQRPLTKEHYCCIIDLLGRSGQLLEAEKLIHRLGIQTDPVIWNTLLGACRFHKDVQRAQRAAEGILKQDPEHPPAYVVLSNIFAASEEKYADKGASVEVERKICPR